MLVVSGLVESLAEVLIHDPGDLPDVVGVEDHIPGQVLRGPVQLLLAVALPAQPDMLITIVVTIEARHRRMFYAGPLPRIFVRENR